MEQGSASAFCRAGAALVLLKTYRTCLMLGADLADAQANDVHAQHGDDDPVASVLRDIARSNRVTKHGLEECASAVEAHFMAQMHAAAVRVVGATASYAHGVRYMDEFARKFASASEQGRALGARLQDAVHPPRLPRSPPVSGPRKYAAIQLVLFWRTCLLYAKLACYMR